VLKPGASLDATQSDVMERFRQLTRLKLDSVEWLSQEDMPLDAPLLVNNKH